MKLLIKILETQKNLICIYKFYFFYFCYYSNYFLDYQFIAYGIFTTSVYIKSNSHLMWGNNKWNLSQRLSCTNLHKIATINITSLTTPNKSNNSSNLAELSWAELNWKWKSNGKMLPFIFPLSLCICICICLCIYFGVPNLNKHLFVERLK